VPGAREDFGHGETRSLFHIERQLDSDRGVEKNRFRMFDESITPAPRTKRVLEVAAVTLCILLMGCAQLGGSQDPPPEIPDTIPELKAAIEADRATLTDLVSEPTAEDGDLDERADTLGVISSRLALMHEALVRLELEEAGRIHKDPIGGASN
jgi:hypothetical protein